MAVNPNKNGTTADPLWIDGGTANTAPTWNLSDPTMWLPMTTISGLASGLCERAAVVSGAITNFPAGLAWVPEAQDAQGIYSSNAANATQTEKVANNIATHGGVSTIFTSVNDPTMTVPGTAAGFNYMSTVDSAISALIVADGGFKRRVVTGGNVSYVNYAFTDLAADAKARAGNDIAYTPSFGGANIKGTMVNAYPVEWAKERKWMLDELKYTTQESAYTKPDALGRNIEFTETGSRTPVASVESCRAFEYANASSSTNPTYAYCGITTSQIEPGPQTGIGRCFYTIMTAKTTSGSDESTHRETWQLDGWSPRYYDYGDEGDTYSWLKEGDNTVWTVVPNDPKILNKAINISVLFGQGTVLKNDYQSYSYSSAISGHIISGTTAVTGASTDTNHVSYEVKSGGTLTVPSGQQPFAIVVSSGGTVQVNNGGLIHNCVILDGGTVTGIPNVMNLSMSGFYPDAPKITTIQWPFGNAYASASVVNAGVSYSSSIAATPYSTNLTEKDYYISGATFNYAVATGGTTEINAESCHFIVEKGGTLTFGGVDSDATAIIKSSFIKVLSGGVVEMRDYSKLLDTVVYVYPGGSLDLHYSRYGGVNDINGGCRYYFAPGSIITANIRPAIDRYSGYYIPYVDEEHIPGEAHFHFKKNGITTETAAGDSADIKAQKQALKPNLEVTWNMDYNEAGYYPPASSFAPVCSSVFAHTILYVFNGNGIVINGETSSVQEGYSVIETTVNVAGATVYLCGNTGSLAAIDAENSPPIVNATGPEEITENGYKYLGFDGTDIMYRCAITTLDIDPVPYMDHYSSFRCRQFYENPDSATQ